MLLKDVFFSFLGYLSANKLAKHYNTIIFTF